MTHVKERLKEIYETTIESGLRYNGSLDKLEYYSLFCKAAANDQLYKLMGNNLCMFNCQVDNNESVMLLFSIPINSSEDSGAKNVAERVMEVVENIEKCFITIDDIKTETIQEDKFIYIRILKTCKDII